MSEVSFVGLAGLAVESVLVGEESAGVIWVGVWVEVVGVTLPEEVVSALLVWVAVEPAESVVLVVLVVFALCEAALVSVVVAEVESVLAGVVLAAVS